MRNKKITQDFRDAREPPIGIGTVVEMPSGGPACLVVDVDNIMNVDYVVIAWRSSKNSSEINETKLPRACVQRSRRLW